MLKVTKLDGSQEDYSENKIRASANRVGVPSDLQEAMLKSIRGQLYDGIKTSEIYQIIKSYLATTPHAYLSSKYNLKSSLAQLGPSGYPFEQYLGQLLTALGYQTKTNQLVEGSCVSHEIDIVAVKDNTTHLVEAKFHKQPGQKTDVKVTLYIRARYEDIYDKMGDGVKPWLMTNTRFTSEALKYGRCRDLTLTSWDYPRGEGLRELIESVGLHPITMLDSLLEEDRRLLLSQNIVVCRQLINNKPAQELIPSARRQATLAEAAAVCPNHSS